MAGAGATRARGAGPPTPSAASITVSVMLEIPPATISRTPSLLTPSCTVSENATSQTLEVWNSGGGTLNYTITDNQDWLSASPESGSSTGEHNAIAVTYATTDLPVGTHEATIEISDPGASNSPQEIVVRLTVAPPPTPAGTPSPEPPTATPTPEAPTVTPTPEPPTETPTPEIPTVTPTPEPPTATPTPEVPTVTPTPEEPTGTPTPEIPTVTPTPEPPTATPTPIASVTPTPDQGTPTPTPPPIRDTIVSFYQVILGRDPEPGAEDAWYQYLEYAVGFDIDVRFIPREMARLFFLSEEYAMRNRSDAEFIADCYRVFLGRDPSERELSEWLQGAWNRAQVMTAFSESEEFANRIEAMHPGLGGNPTRNFVTTMYIGLLDRLVDQNGLEYAAGLFDAAFASGGVEAVRAQAKQMAREVIVSDEFLGGNPAPGDYVTRLYRAFLGRFPSDPEMAYWILELLSGRKRSNDLITLFADSEEFAARLQEYFGL